MTTPQGFDTKAQGRRYSGAPWETIAKKNQIEPQRGSTTDYVGEDASGNMTAIPSLLTPSSSLLLKYDAWNRLVEVKDGANTVLRNEYDVLHRRVVRDVYAAGSSDHRIHYYYNENWQLLEEPKEVSSTIDADPLNQYIWHPYYIDALALRIYDADTDGNVAENADGLYYYQHDANFNVTAVTNLSGTVVERYKYTPYGQLTVLDPNFANDSDGISDIGNTHFYTGRELDPETGLQLNRWRFYASWLGRWVTRDPIGYEGSEWNLYEAVNNSPVNFTDPTGQWPEWYDNMWNKCFGNVPTPPPLPPPPPPCTKKKPNDSHDVPTPPAVGWDTDDIGDCYKNCQKCNKSPSKGKCGDCCDSCYDDHVNACASLLGPSPPGPKPISWVVATALCQRKAMSKRDVCDANCK